MQTEVFIPYSLADRFFFMIMDKYLAFFIMSFFNAAQTISDMRRKVKTKKLFCPSDKRAFSFDIKVGCGRSRPAWLIFR